MTRREAREIVLGLLFETEFRNEETKEEIYGSSAENREIPNDDFVKNTYYAICDNRLEIDAIIGENSNGWRPDRLGNVSRAILRLAVYEMRFVDSIPFTVTINEAVELAKKYDDEKARPFINGVLNSVKNALENKA
jgi:N utilization substance protein B